MEFKVTQLASERAQVPMRGIPKSKLFPLYNVFSEHAPLSGHGTGIYKGCVGWGGVKGVLFFFFLIAVLRQSRRHRTNSDEG